MTRNELYAYAIDVNETSNLVYADMLGYVAETIVDEPSLPEVEAILHLERNRRNSVFMELSFLVNCGYNIFHF